MKFSPSVVAVATLFKSMTDHSNLISTGLQAGVQDGKFTGAVLTASTAGKPLQRLTTRGLWDLTGLKPGVNEIASPRRSLIASPSRSVETSLGQSPTPPLHHSITSDPQS